MRLDIPECKRCFLCIPLRYGIITFGYLNLIFGLFVVSVELVWLEERGNGTIAISSETVSTYKGVTFYVQAWLPLLLHAVELFFNVILLVGAHMKLIKLIRVYYCYGVTTLLATFATFLVVRLSFHLQHYDIIDMCITFIGLMSQAYLLLLIRTEMSKRRYTEDSTDYVNHMANVSYPTNWRDTDML